MFTAQCHCGNVILSVKEAPDSLTSCNCSICYRLGALWAYFNAKDVEIQINLTPTSYYQWDKKEIDFHHCPECGCTTHYSSFSNIGEKQIAINARMLSAEEIKRIQVRKFDGADTWKYLDD